MTAVRRIHIVRDTASPLWFVTCVEPCGPGGARCQTNPRRPEQKPVCWLGAGMMPAHLAKMWVNDPAYELINAETLQSHAVASITNEGQRRVNGICPSNPDDAGGIHRG